jgi:hypothetical protein
MLAYSILFILSINVHLAIMPINVRFIIMPIDVSIRGYIGDSIATIAHGVPRTTLDVDIIVELSHAQVDRFVALVGWPCNHLQGNEACVWRTQRCGGK